LAMFCNEWTWVSLKKIQIEKVERNERILRPCGRLKEKREEMRPCQTKPNILLARGL
jgi:hypothetical protein